MIFQRKDACYQTWWAELFHFWDTYGRRWELTPKSRPLTSTCILWYLCASSLTLSPSLSLFLYLSHTCIHHITKKKTNEILNYLTIIFIKTNTLCRKGRRRTVTYSMDYQKCKRCLLLWIDKANVRVDTEWLEGHFIICNQNLFTLLLFSSYITNPS